MKKLLATAAIAGGALFGLAGQASADGHCGSLMMAEMNWASAELMANVDKIILDSAVTGGGQGVLPYLPLNELRRGTSSSTTSGGSN